jgi:hypothetical protein
MFGGRGVEVNRGVVMVRLYEERKEFMLLIAVSKPPSSKADQVSGDLMVAVIRI